MIRNILILALGLSFSAAASAQEFGAVLGFHQTSADVSTTNSSIDGKLGYKLGLAVGFELVEATKFRTGLLYNQRNFDISRTAGDVEVKLGYLDIPALVQYNVNETFGFFGGLVFGINVSDEAKVSSGPSVDVDADSLIPFATAGVNLTFSDMIGFDFYYERGLGGFGKDLQDFSTFGANFLYWF